MHINSIEMTDKFSALTFDMEYGENGTRNVSNEDILEWEPTKNDILPPLNFSWVKIGKRKGILKNY